MPSARSVEKNLAEQSTLQMRNGFIRDEKTLNHHGHANQGERNEKEHVWRMITPVILPPHPAAVHTDALTTCRSVVPNDIEQFLMAELVLEYRKQKKLPAAPPLPLFPYVGMVDLLTVRRDMAFPTRTADLQRSSTGA